MKELWSELVDVKEEEQIILDRWNEIYKECYLGLKSKEYRKRQASCSALSDYLLKKQWSQISSHFKEIFLISFGLLDDDKDTVKMAAFNLLKTMKRISL